MVEICEVGIGILTPDPGAITKERHRMQHLAVQSFGAIPSSTVSV